MAKISCKLKEFNKNCHDLSLDSKVYWIILHTICFYTTETWSVYVTGGVGSMHIMDVDPQHNL